MAHGSPQQHLTCSFMPACLRCRTLVDTKVLLCTKYVLCCYGFRSLACASWCSEEEKQVQTHFLKVSLFVFLGGHIASRADDTASFVSKKSTSPAVMVTSRLVLPSAMTWTEKSACVANLPHIHQQTRASCWLLLLWCCCCIAVGSGAAATTSAYGLVLSPHQL